MEELAALLADFIAKRDQAAALAAEAAAKLAESQNAAAVSQNANNDRETARSTLLMAIKAA